MIDLEDILIIGIPAALVLGLALVLVV